jgi:hypothetical protein
MIRSFGIVHEAATHVAAAAERVLDAHREGRVQQEPAFTDRMLGAIENSMRDFQTKGVRWRAMTLTDRGRNAQESRHGADFAGVLSIDLLDFKVQKGFLAQAKMVEPAAYMPQSQYDRMKAQCDLMLNRTPDSFLFLYSRDAVTVVPALSVVSSPLRNPHEFYSRSIARFYEEHFESFIGDRRLYAPTPSMLESLQRDVDARVLLYLEARDA